MTTLACGPFCRLETPTQTKQDALDQVATGEVWGTNARFNGLESVKAYRRSLSQTERGINFTTNYPPTSGSGTPLEARWYHGTTGVMRRTKNGIDYAAISAAVDNHQP